MTNNKRLVKRITSYSVSADASVYLNFNSSMHTKFQISSKEREAYVRLPYFCVCFLIKSSVKRTNADSKFFECNYLILNKMTTMFNSILNIQYLHTGMTKYMFLCSMSIFFNNNGKWELKMIVLFQLQFSVTDMSRITFFVWK